MVPLKSPVPAPASPPPKLNGCAVVVVARPKVPAGFAPNKVLPEIETQLYIDQDEQIWFMLGPDSREK